MKRKYQIVRWFPKWIGFHYGKWEGGMSLVYEWSLGLGFIEIRKWHKDELEDK